MKNCPGCGALLQEGASICEYCGTAVRQERTEPAAASETEEKKEHRGDLLPEKPAASAPRAVLRTASPVLLFFLSFLTFFLYPVFWVFLRRKAFDSMVPEKKLGLVLPLVFLAATACFVAAGNIGKITDFPLTLEERETLAGWSFLAWYASMTAVSFRMRTLLRKYASRADGSSLAAHLVARSSILTFFLQFLYIQHHMNMLVESGLADRE